MPRSLQILLLGFLAVVYGLSALSYRYPEIAWLQPFKLPKLPPEQQARLRRRANIHAGVELILMGLALPLGYFVLTVMMFNEFTAAWIVAVAGLSLLCIGLGATAIWQNRS